MKFHNYGRPIYDISTLLVLQMAADDALHWHSRADEPIGEQIVSYIDGVDSQNKLQLILRPGPLMTWDLWYESVGGIAAFVDEYEYRELQFSVLIGPGAVVANGSLMKAQWS